VGHIGVKGKLGEITGCVEHKLGKEEEIRKSMYQGGGKQ